MGWHCLGAFLGGIIFAFGFSGICALLIMRGAAQLNRWEGER
jgi:vacuolar-type H+-ATPase subunit I/STV1